MLRQNQKDGELTSEQRRLIEERTAEVNSEHRVKDGTSGMARVVDHQGQIIKCFDHVSDAQSFIADQPHPDQFGIKFENEMSCGFDVKQTAQELASAGESDADVAAERMCEERSGNS